MNKDQLFADIFVHLHPETLCHDKEKVQHELCQSWGVFSVHFDVDEQNDTMVVAYNPEVVSDDKLLDIIRKNYSGAVKVAAVLMRVSH